MLKEFVIFGLGITALSMILTGGLFLYDWMCDRD